MSAVPNRKGGYGDEVWERRISALEKQVQKLQSSKVLTAPMYDPAGFPTGSVNGQIAVAAPTGTPAKSLWAYDETNGWYPGGIIYNYDNEGGGLSVVANTSSGAGSNPGAGINLADFSGEGFNILGGAIIIWADHTHTYGAITWAGFSDSVIITAASASTTPNVASIIYQFDAAGNGNYASFQDIAFNTNTEYAKVGLGVSLPGAGNWSDLGVVYTNAIFDLDSGDGVFLNSAGHGGIGGTSMNGGGIFFTDKGAGGTFFDDRDGGGIFFDIGFFAGTTTDGFSVQVSNDGGIYLANGFGGVHGAGGLILADIAPVSSGSPGILLVTEAGTNISLQINQSPNPGGQLNITGIPMSNPGGSGNVWNNAGVLNIT